MQDYQKLYTHLFNAMTDAVAALDARNYGTAEEILKKAQQWTEETYMETDDAVDET